MTNIAQERGVEERENGNVVKTDYDYTLPMNTDLAHGCICENNMKHGYNDTLH